MKTIAIFALAALASLPLFADEHPPLFNGKTLDQWVTADGKPAPAGWEVADGVIHLAKGKGAARGGNIFTKHEYANYRLTFEWKISAGGNNGIKYRVNKYGGQWLGCEYQMYDDVSHNYKPDSPTSTASIYALYGPSKNKVLHKAGEEYNTSTIVVQGDKIEHWLNGEKVVEAHPTSKEWRKRVARSKFRSKMHFGEQEFGRIMITDHNDEVWIRKIAIEPIGDLPFSRPLSSRKVQYEEPPTP